MKKIENDVEQLGAKVIYVDINNVDNSPSTELLKGMHSEISKFENNRRAELSRETKRTKASKQKFVSGRTSYGYVINKDCEFGLEVIDSEIETVRMIYDLFTEKGFSLGQITKELNKLGIPAYKGGKWNRSAVWNILTNTTYAGYTYYGKFRSVKKKNDSGKLVQVFIENDKETWIKHGTPAVISLNQFNKAQKMLEHNRKTKRQETARNYLLSGMIYCDECGKVHSGQTKLRPNGEDTYYAHLVKRGGCRNLWLRADTLEAAVWNKVKEILLNPDALIAGYEQDANAHQKALDSKKEKLAFLQDKVDKYKQQRMNLHLIYSSPDNVMSKSEYLEANEHIKSNLDAIEADIATLTEEINNTISPESVETFRQFTSAIQNVLHHELDNNDKREIMRRLNIKVMVIDKDTIRLDGYFTTKPFGVTDVSNMRTLQTTVTHINFSLMVSLAA